MAEYRIWPATNGPNLTLTDGLPISMGTEFLVTTTGMYASKIWYWRGGTAQGSGPNAVQGQIYHLEGGGVGTPLLITPASFASPVALGWQSVSFTPIPLTINHRYKVVVYYPDNDYTATGNYWNAGGPGENGIINGPLTAVAANNSNEGQGTFKEPSSGIQYPTSAFQSGNYWIDVTVTDSVANPVKNAAFMAFFQ